jgi:tetratricopeptide (TPR) repeat protein
MEAEQRKGFREAESLYLRALNQSRMAGDEVAQASILRQLGMVAEEQKHLDEAERWYRESLSISERLGDETSRAETLQQLGKITQVRGELPDALRLLEQAATIFRQTNNPYGLDDVEKALTQIRERMKNPQ